MGLGRRGDWGGCGWAPVGDRGGGEAEGGSEAAVRKEPVPGRDPDLPAVRLTPALWVGLNTTQVLTRPILSAAAPYAMASTF